MKNTLALFAAIMIVFSLFTEGVPGRIGRTLHSIAYFLGAGAYIAELLLETDMFRHKPPLDHIFMPLIFGLLYIIIGVTDMFFAH